MDPEAHRAVSARGGRAAHAKGTGRKFTREQAAEAGRNRGQAGHAKGTAHEFTAEEAQTAGSRAGGGLAAWPVPTAGTPGGPRGAATRSARRAVCCSGRGRCDTMALPTDVQ